MFSDSKSRIEGNAVRRVEIRVKYKVDGEQKFRVEQTNNGTDRNTESAIPCAGCRCVLYVVLGSMRPLPPSASVLSSMLFPSVCCYFASSLGAILM